MLWNLFNRIPKPYSEGFLPPQDGHTVYYYEYGNPQGIPVLSFHGGPGGESRPKYAKLFDLKKYRFIQFDQRGCGKSFANDIFYKNETKYLIQDAMHLLAYLHIDTPVIVQGASWGSTMALLFTETYPQSVRQIIISSVFLARPEDYGWVNHESERFYPDLWDEMRKQYKHTDFFETHQRLLFSKKEQDNIKALTYWGSYEYKLGQLNPQFELTEKYDEKALNSAQIAFYYDRHHFFLNNNQILRNINKIKHIPTIIAHNRLDFCCPVKQAWELHKAMPNSILKICAQSGHSNPKLIKEVKKMIRCAEKK